MQLMERVTEAQRFARMELSETNSKKGKGKRSKRPDDEDDTEESTGVRKKFKKKKGK
ncbi:ATP-dependent RNA helicase DDX47 [Mizuhopecten yessoensis]|uniref:ATP-dependent RNA helicase DDX47 n=1 Tax=Mizuhopecten yessoensis TaxID=6573 RepID=A0A210Q884_MIZYE|nr:ATP-dependent RNA helicase DDX47 [Mizuhopecten yessoensis]